MHPHTNLRMIALNPFTYNTYNTYIWGNSTDPQGDFAWLWQTLMVAEANNENVIILAHIAPSTFDTERNWNLYYNALIDRYSNIIKLQVSGHSHADYLQLIKGISDPSQVVGLSFVMPQLGIRTNTHPSFRVYDLQSDNYQFVDYHQYRLYIQEANRDIPKWRLAYTFKDLYHLDNTTFESIARSIENINVIMINRMIKVLQIRY